METDIEKPPPSRWSKLKHLFRINTYMIPSKITFLLFGAHIGSYTAFLNVFFLSVGLTKFHAGFATGILYALPIVAGPMWGYIADRTLRMRLILFILCIGSSIPLFSMPWIADYLHPMYRNFCSNASSIMVASNATSLSQYSAADCGQSESTLFLTFVLLILFTSIFLVPLPIFIETLLMKVVKSDPNKGSFGNQRLFNSIGLSVTNYLAGRSVDAVDEQVLSPYTPVFYYFLPITLLLFPMGCILISQQERSEKKLTMHNFDKVVVENPNVNTIKDYNSTDRVINEENKNGSLPDGKQREIPTRNNLIKEFLKFLSKLDASMLMLTALVSGIANNLFLHFSYILITDEMNRTKSEMTLVTVIATVSDACFFPLADYVREKLGGSVNSLIVGLLAHFIRFLVMSYDVPFFVVVVIQTLSAIGYALSWASFMEHVHDISPIKIKFISYAFMMAMFNGAGNLIANMLGGKFYALYGVRKLFFGEAMLCVAWATIMIIYYGGRYFKKKLCTKVFDE